MDSGTGGLGVSSRFFRVKPPKANPLDETRRDEQQRRYNARVAELIRPPSNMLEMDAKMQASYEIFEQGSSDVIHSAAVPKALLDVSPTEPKPEPKPERVPKLISDEEAAKRQEIATAIKAATPKAKTVSKPRWEPKPKHPRPKDVPILKGVDWNPYKAQWRASVRGKTGGSKILGEFPQDKWLECARLYDAETVKIYGYAKAKHRINYPDEHRTIDNLQTILVDPEDINPVAFEPEPDTKIQQATIKIEESHSVEVGCMDDASETEESLRFEDHQPPPRPSLRGVFAMPPSSAMDVVDLEITIQSQIVQLVRPLEPKRAVALLKRTSELIRNAELAVNRGHA